MKTAEQILAKWQGDSSYIHEDDAIGALNEALSLSEKEEEWISVKERLPEGGKHGCVDVLCLVDGVSCKVLTFLDGDNETCYRFYMDYRKHFDNYTNRVSHWIDLPNIPKSK